MNTWLLAKSSYYSKKNLFKSEVVCA